MGLISQITNPLIKLATSRLDSLIKIPEQTITVPSPSRPPDHSQRADQSQEKAKSNLKTRLDTLVNLMTGFGEPQDKTLYSKPDYGYHLSQIDLEIIYEQWHIAGRIVDLPPNHCTRKGWTIAVGPDKEEIFNDYLKRLDFTNTTRQADIWARVYGGGAIVLSIDDDKEHSEPVDYNNIKTIKFARAVDRWELYPLEYGSEWESDYFGVPELYTLNVPYSKFQDTIHASRIIRFEGIKLPRFREIDELYWGGSELQRCWPPLCRYETAEVSMETLLHEYEVGVWKLNNLANMAASGNEQKLLNRVQAATMAKSVFNAIMIDAQNEEFTRSTSSAQGLAAIITDVLAPGLSACSGIPQTLLFGDTPAGLSTDNQSGTRNWNEAISSRQQSVYYNPIDRMTKLISLAKDGPTKGKLVDYTITFDPLDEPTEKEKAETDNTNAKTDQVYISEGVLTPSEVRKDRFPDKEEMENPDPTFKEEM